MRTVLVFQVDRRPVSFQPRLVLVAITPLGEHGHLASVYRAVEGILRADRLPANIDSFISFFPADTEVHLGVHKSIPGFPIAF